MNTRHEKKLVRFLVLLPLAIGGLLGAFALHAHLRSNSELLVHGQVLGFEISGVLSGVKQESGLQLQPVPSPAFDFPESLGYPVPIREDGTISLPCIPAVQVEGKSVQEVRHLVSAAYQEILPSENCSIRICVFPNRKSWSKKTWDRVRLRDYLWVKVHGLFDF